MISRTDGASAVPALTGRLILLALVAVALGVGIVIAFKYGPSVTPLLDDLH